ncbi:MFS general substrate transporter [Lactarius quietus]|nr:MFS general substrate transporter [Lactarius quietus]
MTLTRFEDDHELDEDAPFLPDQEVLPHLKPTRTPLPITQLSILLTVWFAESIISQSISPYLNQLLRALPEVGGDARKVGYYTGIIMSLHYASEAATAFPWNRLSDHVGRRPVLLSCLAGTTIAVLLFGLSHSFLALVLSRCLHGAMKGYIGTVKSTIAELTDETNIARGFSLPPVAWSLGGVFGPLIGGVLSRPQDRWPHMFSHHFWADYPYFLPCLVAASFTLFSFVVSALYLEETLNSRPSEKIQLARVNTNASSEEEDDDSDLDVTPDQSDKPLPMSSVLTKPVLVTIANYAMLALLSTIMEACTPLVWSTPIEYGGLNLDPATIGMWMSLYGGLDGIFQFFVFPHYINRIGLRLVFVCSILSCAVIFVIFPFENLAAVAGKGPNMVVWLLIILQLLSLCIFDSGYPAIYMYVSSAVPNKRLLGAANGLAQVATSIQAAVGPAVADWLFAFSLTNNVLGGNLAYVVIIGVVCFALGVTTRLPRKAWNSKE